MSEIEIGEYIRTENQGINRVRKIEYDIDAKENYYYTDDIFGEWEYRIKKHSKNIIDLIEAGDYVNGKKVIALTVLNNEEISICVFKDREYMHCEILKDKDITSIVTKKQFEQMKYIVKDEI